jgi:hypothetical protein
MDKIKIGFVPAHREPFNEEWAAVMLKRCIVKREYRDIINSRHNNQKARAVYLTVNSYQIKIPNADT